MPQTEHERAADELVSLLARRIEVLECLLDETMTRPELVDELEISRSTVDRSVRELEGMGLLEFHDGTYRASLPGRLAHTEYAELREELVTVEEAADLLAVLPPDAPLDLDVLRGAEVVVATEPAPHVPGSRIPDLLENADHVRSLSTALTTPSTGDIIADGVLNHEMTIEVVFEQDLYRYLHDSGPMDLEVLAATDRFHQWVVDTLPFGLLIIERDGDRQVCLAIYDADQTLEGIIINDSDAAITWAASVFRSYREAATPTD
ncbi:MAG: helix-turn-helix transcriptional regulator [Halobacteriaceae archaeon]